MLNNAGLFHSILALGVMGLLSKASLADELPQAIRQVRQQRTYVAQTIRQALSLAGEVGADRLHSQEHLSPRELEVIRLLAGGMTVGEIAAHLHRSKQTVSAQKSAPCASSGWSMMPPCLFTCRNTGWPSLERDPLLERRGLHRPRDKAALQPRRAQFAHGVIVGGGFHAGDHHGDVRRAAMLMAPATTAALRSSLAIPQANAGDFQFGKGSSSKCCRLVPPMPKSPMDNWQPNMRKRSNPVTWALSVFNVEVSTSSRVRLWAGTPCSCSKPCSTWGSARAPACARDVHRYRQHLAAFAHHLVRQAKRLLQHMPGKRLFHAGKLQHRQELVRQQQLTVLQLPTRQRLHPCNTPA